MRLNAINGSKKTFYKGMTLSNFEKFKRHRIPGFLADLHMALIYADMRYAKEPLVLISVNIDPNEIEDKRGEIDDMCGAWQHPDNSRYNELRGKIWWSTSGGHGMRGIYCGKPVDDYKVLFVAHNMDEMKAHIEGHRHILDKTKDLHSYDTETNEMVDRSGRREITWKDF